MKTLFVLCSSLILNKPKFKKHKIGLQYGNSRLNQYEKGFKILLDKNIYSNFNKTLLVDNTLDSKENIPSNIRRYLNNEWNISYLKKINLVFLIKVLECWIHLIELKII